MDNTPKYIEKIGRFLVDSFHYLALFVILVTIIWSAGYEYIQIIGNGHAELKDILLLFIYLELGAMVGVYFKTKRLPVEFLIFVAITALARHLVIDVQKVSDTFHIYLLLSLSGAVVLLSGAIYILGMSAKKYGRPDDE